MSIKHILGFIILFFAGFFALYTWNSRTGTLDEASTTVGLEITGGVLKSVDSLVSGVQSLWYNYIDLVDTRQENLELKAYIADLEAEVDAQKPSLEELKRLQTIYSLKPQDAWGKVPARVLATRLGIFSVLETVLLDKGYLSGVLVGRPIMTNRYLLGRVYQASPTTSIALMIEDLGSRVAVISGETRLQGILSGAGSNKPLELRFINQTTYLEIGEILYTSGLNGSFPRGIPVAEIISMQSESSEVFQVYYAKPLANFASLEEVVVLTPPLGWEQRMAEPVLSRSNNEEIPLAGEIVQ